MKKTSDLESIRGNCILLDTSFITLLSRSEVSRNELKNLLINFSCIPVTIPHISVEFINGAAKDHDIISSGTESARLASAVQFLKELIRKNLIVTEERANFVTLLSIVNSYAICSNKFKNTYNKTKQPKPSFVDLTIGAMTFQKNVVLATLNHKDFPLYLYDRVAILSFSDGSDVGTVGFYKINESQYSKLIANASEQIKKVNKKTNKKTTKKKIK